MNKTTILTVAVILVLSGLLFAGPSDNALKAAFEKGDSDAVLKLLAAEPNLLKADLGGGETPLHAAVKRGLEPVFDHVLGMGVDVNAKDGRGLTPAWYAVTQRRPALLRKLIARGADLKIVNKLSGDNMIFAAASAGNAEVFGLLLDNGFKADEKKPWGQTPLDFAAQANSLEIIKLIAGRGVDLKAASNPRFPLLHMATSGSKVDLLKYLLDQGFEVNFKDTMRQTTALLRAVYNGNIEAARLLAQRGADVNAPDVLAMTPVMLAVKKGYKDLVELFLSRGADLNAADFRTGKTMLHFAAARGQSAVVEALLKSGLDKNAKDKNGRTALAYAMKHGNLAAADALRKHGAQDPAAESHAGDSTLLHKPLGEGDALIWHFLNSGWAIKTKSALLIFDYWDNDTAPDEMLLANGHIRPAEIRDLPVYVFVTHGHFDHYDPRIFEWKKTVPNITYIFGFEPDTPEEIISMAPRTQKTVGPLAITTTQANDEGVGFAVQVDGLAIFHSGDHMNFQPEEKDNIFFAEFDFLAGRGLRADLLFLPTAWTADEMALSQKGVFYAVDKLQAKAFFPMHGNNRESMYADWVDYAVQKKSKVQVGAASDPGDWFFFSKGVLSR